MKAKINEKILCIPPYLSTTWDQVLFLNSEENVEFKKMTLVVHLNDGKIVNIRDLEPSLVDIAFTAHMQFLEKNEKAKAQAGPLQNLINDQMMAFPIRFGISSMPQGMNMDGFETALQHNPQAAQSPNIPPEVLEKIAAITKVITNGDVASFPKPEPHCNCMHCQVARAVHKGAEALSEAEETTTAEDLHFRSWDILQTGENLYSVSNPIDAKERYNVFLGTPVGCTCGTPHCEHIKAVLYS